MGKPQRFAEETSGVFFHVGVWSRIRPGLPPRGVRFSSVPEKNQVKSEETESSAGSERGSTSAEGQVLTHKYRAVSNEEETEEVPVQSELQMATEDMSTSQSGTRLTSTCQFMHNKSNVTP
ncbi:hypothetical protein JOB18_010818 [Solea senegalensis]|uniref:Uncharacterized protein n=1 Tax=Solea senegalensis TaxID=28829 RepID=A0AAV6Q9C5_SOLSE|nr:hypothetical protein JOB18_010818 [Solea senegalensis]